MDAASILERRTAVPRCALFVLSEISAARRIGGFLPFRSICAEPPPGRRVICVRESPAISRRSTRRGRKDWCTRRRSGCSDPAPSGPAQRTADQQTRAPGQLQSDGLTLAVDGQCGGIAGRIALLGSGQVLQGGDLRAVDGGDNVGPTAGPPQPPDCRPPQSIRSTLLMS